MKAIKQIWIAILILVATSSEAQLFISRDAKVSFSSKAKLETISCINYSVGGALDLPTNTFAFTVKVALFDGFNSALQKIHFNENYLETELYPKATFTGKIIEDIDYTTNGKFQVRAKGLLDIHGVKQERIILIYLTVEQKKISYKANFSINLQDHNIGIPRIVNNKLTPIIEVEVAGTMQPKI